MTNMVNYDNIEYSKTLQKFSCKQCNFKCSNKQDYTRHLSTLKHERVINGNNNPPKNSNSNICLCGKKYKHISGLSRHKKNVMVLKKRKK